MKQVDTARHRVAIAGFVSDALTGAAIAGADVEMASTPNTFATRLALVQQTLGEHERKLGGKWKALIERPDRTRSREDGSFYFLDLPEGKYTLSITAPAFGKRYGSAQKDVAVQLTGEGRYVLDWVSIAVPPTAVRGAITSKKVNIGFAHVRVQWSGESVICNDAGQYLITRLEPGRRTLLVNAEGFRPATQDISIGAPGEAHVVNFNMTPDRG